MIAAYHVTVVLSVVCYIVHMLFDSTACPGANSSRKKAIIFSNLAKPWRWPVCGSSRLKRHTDGSVGSRLRSSQQRIR